MENPPQGQMDMAADAGFGHWVSVCCMYDLFVCMRNTLSCRYDYIIPNKSRKDGKRGVDWFHGDAELMAFVKSNKALRLKHGISHTLVMPAAPQSVSGSKYSHSFVLSFCVSHLHACFDTRTKSRPERT